MQVKSLARDSGNEHDPLRALGNTYKWGDEKREEALLQFLWNISSLTLELGRAKNLVHLGTSAQCAFWVVGWPCSQNGPVSNTIRRWGRYRGIFREEGVDTGAYFRGNHGPRD